MAADKPRVLAAGNSPVARVVAIMIRRKDAAVPPSLGQVSTTQDQRFRELVLPELDVLLRVARRLTRDVANAEDLVQDTLVLAYRAIDRFDGRHPRAWLLTILRNRFLNDVRRVRPDLLDAEVAQQLPGRGVDARIDGTEHQALAAEFDPLVREAVGTLSTNHRAVVALVDLDGLSYQEAADLLRVPIGTVMSRLHRARGRIRAQLEANGFTKDAR